MEVREATFRRAGKTQEGDKMIQRSSEGRFKKMLAHCRGNRLPNRQNINTQTPCHSQIMWQMLDTAEDLQPIWIVRDGLEGSTGQFFFGIFRQMLGEVESVVRRQMCHRTTFRRAIDLGLGGGQQKISQSRVRKRVADFSVFSMLGLENQPLLDTCIEGGKWMSKRFRGKRNVFRKRAQP